ncbi:MAG: hypothetical protein Ct9H90mP4_11230 [Gammaproteobacteria bacterium]|nr:MAG: hypothetical protein Ct9H90mP4_11230 [Gammaproteobacteria bacterium]
MSKLRVDQIRKIIRPCGLSPKKSKAIKELSKILLSEHKGQVPEDFESLERLPGVGHKTASVVMSKGVWGVQLFLLTLIFIGLHKDGDLPMARM